MYFEGRLCEFFVGAVEPLKFSYDVVEMNVNIYVDCHLALASF